MALAPINPTQLTPPRVALIDERSGAISREWYRFFLSLLTATETNQQETGTAPDANALMATYDAMLAALAQETQTNTSDLSASLQQQINDVFTATAITPPPSGGTVTSVDASGGSTGLLFTGGPITTSGTLTLSGTLVAVNGGTGQTSYTNGQLLIGNTTGNTLAKATLTAGTAINIANGAGSITVTNTAPDQIVSLTGAGTTVVSGTYPNFTITSNDQYTGTVTSVAASGGTTGLTFSGSPITTSGTLTLGGTLAVANGGTGATTLTSGYLLKGNGTSAVTASVAYDDGTRIGIGTTSPSALLTISRNGGGDIGALVSQTNSGNGTTGRYRATHGSGSAVNLEAGNGYVAVNATSASPLLLNTSNTERFRVESAGQWGIGGANYGTAGQVFTSGGAGAAPTWTTPTTGTVTSVSGTGTVNGITLTGTVTTSGSLTLGGTLSNVSLTTQVTGTLPVGNGGTGATTLTGYVKGNGTSAFTASATIPASDVTGLATVATSGSFADLSNKPGIRSNGQNVIAASKTLGAADSGTNILIVTSGITITFPATGFASGEGFAISNVSGGNVTLSAPGGADFGATLPNDGTFFAFCDGGGFWRQYCYSTTRL